MRPIKHIYNKIKKDPTSPLRVLLMSLAPIIPDKLYLKLLFRLKMRKSLNLRNPQTFNEKLQWLKLYDRNPKYSQMVDKFEAKKYVANIIGDEYIIPTIGVYENVEEIPWDSLPNQFVLKCTHDSGGVVICKDKKTLNIKEAKKKLSRGLKRSYFYQLREWPYKFASRRIIIENLLEFETSNGISPEKNTLNNANQSRLGYENGTQFDIFDYKFFCFDGEPKFLKVDFDRFTEHHANYFDLEWNLLPFGEKMCPPKESKELIKPTNFEQMLKISRLLSQGHKFLRVDLYNISGHIYFGELTFFPASGLGSFEPTKWDLIIGGYLKL